MENNQIMKEAQESLKGKWGLSIAACLIVAIITILVNLIGGYLINEDWGGNILYLFIVPPIGVGMALFFLNLHDGNKLEIRTILIHLKKFGLIQY